MTNSWWLRASWDRPARSHETWLLASYQLVVRVEKGRQLQGSAAEIAALLGKSDVGQRVVRASGGGGFCYNYRSSSNCYRLKSLCSYVKSLKTGPKLAKEFTMQRKAVKKLAPRCMSVAKRVDTGRRNSATTTSCLPHGDHKTISRLVDQHRLFTQILPNLPTPTFSDSLATAPGQILPLSQGGL